MKIEKHDIQYHSTQNQTAFEINSKFWFNKRIFTDLFGFNPVSFERATIKKEFNNKNYHKGVLMTLAWGYPRSMRRFQPTKDNIQFLQSFLQGNSILDKSSLYQKFGGLLQIEGIGPSTVTKLLFFAGFTYKNIPCLILDDRVKESMSYYDDFKEVVKAFNNTKVSSYIKYLNRMDELAIEFNISHEQLELFLFNQVWKTN